MKSVVWLALRILQLSRPQFRLGSADCALGSRQPYVGPLEIRGGGPRQCFEALIVHLSTLISSRASQFGLSTVMIEGYTLEGDPDMVL